MLSLNEETLRGPLGPARVRVWCCTIAAVLGTGVHLPLAVSQMDTVPASVPESLLKC